MKKSEQRTEIRKRALEYAKSGEFSSWLLIEHRLALEGYSEARNVLDDHITRQQLDSLCKIAQSPEETQRRTEFKNWMDKIVAEVGPELKKNNLKISVPFPGKALVVSGQKYSIEIRRRFDSMQLENSKSVDSKDGHTYRIGFDRISTDKDYNLISNEDIQKLILKLCDGAASLSEKM
jgi:hypothetical protein